MRCERLELSRSFVEPFYALPVMTKTRLQSPATRSTNINSLVQRQTSEHESTLWEAQRSKRIFEIAQYNWIILPILLAIVYPFFYQLLNNPNNPYFHIPIDDAIFWNPGALMWLLMVLPSKPFHHFSMLATCWPCQPFQLSKRPAKRSFNRLLICLVTRGEQPDVVQRSLQPI